LKIVDQSVLGTSEMARSCSPIPALVEEEYPWWLWATMMGVDRFHSSDLMGRGVPTTRPGTEACGPLGAMTPIDVPDQPRAVKMMVTRTRSAGKTHRLVRGRTM
jgi:hypothetical protein